MTTVLPPSSQPCPEPHPNRKRWTRQECDRLRELGILIGRYELINGEIISKMGQKPPHAVVISLLLQWLVQVFGIQFIRVQFPINVDEAAGYTNEPEPDAVVTVEPMLHYLTHHPTPAELQLVVEVSDTTLNFDLTTKADLYARAGITDYWVMDVNGRRIVTHRDPTPQGYQTIVAYAEEEMLSSLARPEVSVAVADLLPPA